MSSLYWGNLSSFSSGQVLLSKHLRSRPGSRQKSSERNSGVGLWGAALAHPCCLFWGREEGSGTSSCIHRKQCMALLGFESWVIRGKGSMPKTPATGCESHGSRPWTPCSLPSQRGSCTVEVLGGGGGPSREGSPGSKHPGPFLGGPTFCVQRPSPKILTLRKVNWRPPKRIGCRVCLELQRISPPPLSLGGWYSVRGCIRKERTPKKRCGSDMWHDLAPTRRVPTRICPLAYDALARSWRNWRQQAWSRNRRILQQLGKAPMLAKAHKACPASRNFLRRGGQGSSQHLLRNKDPFLFREKRKRKFLRTTLCF